MNTKLGSSVLSVPSWVIPGTYVENLRFLEKQKKIQGVELLFFIYDDEIKKQFDSEWDEILRFRERFNFTAHLPDPLLPAHCELVARLAPVVRHFIVHPYAKDPAAQVALLAKWKKEYDATFLMENTHHGDLEILLPHMEPDAGLCMDTGHLVLEGKNPAEHFAKYRDRIGEIHLHSVNKEQAAIDGRLADHRRLRGDEPWLHQLLPQLADFRGVINLELFSWEEAEPSIGVLLHH